jgi:hypothetical protein
MIQSNFGVDFGDHVHELFEANGSVSVLISIIDHLINFRAWEMLSNTCSDFLEFLRAEGASIACVECLEDALEAALVVWISTEAENF